MDIPTTVTPPRRALQARACALAAVVWLALHAGHSHAITWLCGLSDDGTVLACVADVDARELGGDARPDAAAVTAVVNGTAFPLDPTRVYTVPLWAPPTETEFVQLLARATMCYRSPDCAVVLAPSAWLGDAIGRAPAPRASKTRKEAAAR